MKNIIVLERDNAYFNELKQTLAEISHDSEVVRHTDVQEFFGWLKQVISSAKEGGKKPNITLFIIEQDLLTDKLNVELLGKMQKMLITAGLTSEEKPAGFVLTTYKMDFKDIQKHIHPAIFNIIHKPFDKMTLKEFLKIALAGRKSITTDMYQHDAAIKLELVKEIPMTAVSELGFQTTSKKFIDPGKKARYYAKSFGKDDNDGYLFAYCRESTKVEEGLYKNSFRYFGTSQEVLRQIRINLQQIKDKTPTVLPNGDEAELKAPKNILILTADEAVFEDAKSKILDRFENIGVFWVSDMEDFESSGAPKNVDVHTVFVYEDIHKANDFETVQEFVRTNAIPRKNISYIAFGSEEVKSFEEIKRNNEYGDYFVTPLDRFYFHRQMKQRCPGWAVKKNEDLSRDVVNTDTVIKTATPVVAKKLSELGLTLVTNKEMTPTTLRTFMMPSVDQSTIVEITAMCHFSEKIEKDVYKNDFIFVGVTDQKQKFIRKWLVGKYADTKAKGS